MSTLQDSKQPRPDPAEHNAFFPSAYSLSQFTAPKSDLHGADYPDRYTGGRWKVLVIAADERYLELANGTLFSTGNHPIEMLLPMYHLDAAGFEMDIATVSGNPVKIELWAMPAEDAEINGFHQKYLDKLKRPLKLAQVVAEQLGEDSDYIAVFIPGGHGALIGLPESRDVGAVLHWMMAHDRHVISLCHGPAALLAAAVDTPADRFPFKGYRMCAFPDAMDRQTPDIGYMPGQLSWFFGERLNALGVEIINQEVNGSTHQDRKLLTGDSPLASNRLGQLAARSLLDAVGGR